MEQQQLKDEDLRVTKAISEKSGNILRLAKEALNATPYTTLADGLRLEGSTYVRIVISHGVKGQNGGLPREASLDLEGPTNADIIQTLNNRAPLQRISW